MAKKKKPKTRNPVAKNLRVNKPKVIPNKKKINSRTKGKVGELELVNFLKERGIEARRGQQYEGSSDSPDVVAGGILQNFHIEVKRVEAGSPYNWMDQANTDADLCKTPVVAHRRNGKQWLAIMDFREFLNIVQELYNAKAAKTA
jgi:Archaeal holliday junction resolvase (hjc)